MHIERGRNGHAANAALTSLQPRFAVEAHLAHLFAAVGADGESGDGSGEPDGEGGDGAPERLPVTLPQAAQATLAKCAAQRHDWIGKTGRLNRRATSGAYRRTADFRISTTDSDATPMPQGDGRAHLGYQLRCEATQRRIYEAPAAVCAACTLRNQCTTSRRGRRVRRSLHADTLDRVRGYHTTEPFAKAMRKQQVWVEPLFAEVKDRHGLWQFRLRGLERVDEEALLIAAGQNLKRLLSRWGWGRRPFPSGAAGIVLPAISPTLALTP